LNRADWPALSRKSALAAASAPLASSREAAAEVAAVVAEALVAVKIVEAAEFGEPGGLGGHAFAGGFAGDGKVADDEDEAVAVEVAAAQLVAVRGAGGRGRWPGGRTRPAAGPAANGTESHCSVTAILVLEPGEADLRAGDAGLPAELDDRVLAADAPFASA
jgi:hypothetical protein